MIIGFEKEITGTPISIFPEIPKFHDEIDGVKVGRVKNLFFSSEYLISEIKGNTDSDKGLSLFKFIKNLLSTANSLLGGVNQLDLRLVDKEFTQDDVTTTQPVAEIYDQVQPHEKRKLAAKQDAIPSFKIFGVSRDEKGGFVTDYTLRTEISKELSTMISVGAQAQGTAVGEDATAFSKWNIGLVDRITPKKLEGDQIARAEELAKEPLQQLANITNSYFQTIKLFRISEEGTTSREFSVEDEAKLERLNQELTSLDKKEKDRKKEIERQIEEINKLQYTGYGFPDVFLTPTEGKVNFDRFISIQKQFFTNALAFDAIRKNTLTPTIGFIPIKLSLTLDGLSGIRIFDKLKIESKFLPSNYGDTLEFIITELDHSFVGNKWKTQIGTISIPNTEDKPEAIIPLEELSKFATETTELTDFVGAYSYQWSALGQLIRNSFNSADNVKAGRTRDPGNLILVERTGAGESGLLSKIGELGGVFDPFIDARSWDNIKLAPQDAPTARFYEKEYDGYYYLADEATRGLVKLADQARADGISFTITSAYRSNAHQTRLQNSGVAAQPGSSPHNYGGAIDIGEIAAVTRNENGKLTSDPEINKQTRETSKIYLWLAENGPKYGWYNPARLRDGRGQDEAWHWEFWGVPGETVQTRGYFERNGTIFNGNIIEEIPLIEENVNNTLALQKPGPLYLTTKGDITISE